jgi:hypothetical protein
VKFHVSNILAKLDVSDRTDLSPENFIGTPPAEGKARYAGRREFPELA